MEIAQQAYVGFCQIFDLTLNKMIIIVGLISIGILARNLFSKAVMVLIKKFSQNNQGSLKEEYLVGLLQPISLTFVIGAFYLAGVVAELPLLFAIFYQNLLKTLITFAFFWGVFSVIKPLSHITKKAKKGDINDEMRTLLSKLLEIIVVILGVLSIMEVWGVDVAAFLAGLGILGMAIGFAAQDTIKNFFGCLALLMDKTFQKGHWIKTSLVEGTVEHIGFRTTAIRQFDKALVHIPNAKLADTAVINFAKRTNRRVRWTIGLTYNTPSDALERITKRIRDYLEHHPGIETDPKKVTTLINLDQFSDSSIDLFCYFFTRTINWKEYMDIKEECVLAIKRIVEEEGSSFAFPTKSIHIESVNMNEEYPQHILNKGVQKKSPQKT